jgi:DNA-binding SARP family transcriptional activator
MDIQLIGATEVVTGDRRLTAKDIPGVKPRQILELLALNVGRPVSKDQLAETLWDGSPPASVMATVEGYMSLLRHAIEPDAAARDSVIRTSAGTYTLDASRVVVDVDVVLRLASRLALGAEVTDDEVSTGVALLRGDLLESDRYASWAEEARVQVAVSAASLLTAAARRAADSGERERGCMLAQRAVDLDPLAEDAWRIRLECLWHRGRGGDALRVYGQLKELLATELGVAPAPETRALAARIRADLGVPAEGPGTDPGPAGHHPLAARLVLHTATALGMDPGNVRPAHLETAIREVMADLTRLGLVDGAPALATAVRPA